MSILHVANATISVYVSWLIHKHIYPFSIQMLVWEYIEPFVWFSLEALMYIRGEQR